MHALIEQYSNNLKESQNAIKFVIDRGISKTLIDNQLIGYCSYATRARFPLMKGRITVNINDVHGNFIALAGRQFPPTIDQTVNALYTYYKDTNKAQIKINKWLKSKWINEPYVKSNHLYNLDLAKQFAREKNYLVLVEGYFDALVLYGHGIQNVAAISGLTCSDVQCALIARYCDNVILFLDGDERGIAGATKNQEKIKNCDLFCSNIVLPENYDPDEFVLKYSADKVKSMFDEAILTKKEKIKIKI